MVSSLFWVRFKYEFDRGCAFPFIPTKQADGFHPDKSRVNVDTLAEFIRAPVSGDLNEVCVLL